MAITARKRINQLIVMNIMKPSLLALACCALTCLAVTPVGAMQFYFELSSFSRGNSTSYGIDIYLDTDQGDYDELVDGYILTSPGGDLTIFVDVDSLSGGDGILFPDFDSMARAIFGEWTVEETVIGLPFTTYSFQVRSVGLASSDLPVVKILSPAENSQGVSPTPTITFTTIPNAVNAGIGLYPETGSYPNDGFTLLPGGATEFTPPYTLFEGEHLVYFVAYHSNDSDKVSISQPGGLPWSSFVSLSSHAFSTFTVGGAELRLGAPERVGGQFRWSFATEAGHTYDVQYKDNLNSAAWLPLQTISGDGSTKSFLVSPTQGARFFQVVRR